MPLYASVLPDISLDREFEYQIPEEISSQVVVGSRVLISFGAKRQMDGYVVGIRKEPTCKNHKFILKNYGHFIPCDLMDLAHWIASYYCASRIKVIRSLLPAPIRNNQVKEKQVIMVRIPEKLNLSETLEKLENKSMWLSVFKEVVACHQLPMSVLRKRCNVSQSPIDTLVKKGFLVKEMKQEERDPFNRTAIIPSEKLKLTPQQEQVYDKIITCQKSQNHHTILLQGVTGSGKTEIYLQSIDYCLEMKKQAIVLVPEISLTPQTSLCFRARFGDRVSILHSRLSSGERYDQWMKIYKGETQIVVGARSALFAPFKNLGLLVVDEEHEPSYKQSEQPRYNARDVAVMRGYLSKCTVILGSATPSLESVYNVQCNKYHFCLMNQRASKQALPDMNVVDMRYEKQETGEAKIFSNQLIGAMRERLNEKMQTILFLNRRGFANHLQCQNCGYTAICKRCDAGFSYHRHSGLLRCHLCGDVQTPLKQCPECKQSDLKYFGIGTEKIMVLVQKIFPKARIGRMDSDTMTSKNKYESILNKMSAGQIDILIGTQMIAKGLHFPKVTLVGIILADLSLNIPDFRASERTFQLITQVAGRAGREHTQGEVIIQSYTPFHPAIQSALNADLESFTKLELQGRKACNYPPYSSLVNLIFRSKSKEKLEKFCEDFYRHLCEKISLENLKILEPIPCPIAKVRHFFRYQILVYTPNKILELSRRLYFFINEAKFDRKNIQVQVDIDPQSLS